MDWILGTLLLNSCDLCTKYTQKKKLKMLILSIYLNFSEE